MSSSSSNKLVLVSSDGVSFEIEERIACEFHIEDDCISKKPIPVPNVTGNTLAKVIEYCKKHVEAAADSNEDDEEAKKKKLEDWDDEFIRVDFSTIFEFIHAASFLNVKNLIDLCVQKVTDRIQENLQYPD